jgi:hypothetical protein
MPINLSQRQSQKISIIEEQEPENPPPIQEIQSDRELETESESSDSSESDIY